jgi:hypothetical protein
MTITERRLDTIYQVNPPKTAGHMYVVKYYLHEQPLRQVEVSCRPDVMPQWLKEAIALLDAAGVGYSVAGLGFKSFNYYWIDANAKTSTNT